jgi:hypothetical protein
VTMAIAQPIDTARAECLSTRKSLVRGARLD